MQSLKALQIKAEYLVLIEQALGICKIMFEEMKAAALLQKA